MSVSETITTLVHEIHNLKEFEEIIQKEELFVLDFYSTQCPPCDVVAPLYKKLAEKYTNAKFYKINGLDPEGLIVQKSIDVVWWPTFVIYKNGKEVWRAKIPNPPQQYPTAELEAELKKVYV
ncbi:Thioredoxin [Wickerhamomyces ciferrii]|uniref:Thioredoxin n=1 Tax=Wickerhamomyces ciferrii (strain ATCC 14091 / BCRC 22168 / CBS 111 / JCM 3599 / NBRC 0793 / NRRL Y-1031 F-60-10) TaxID=1206466 RepID=K0KLC9_WICCF|nr:Thioredoxin [Wickerhamomyces ciferrii]CCH41923.1 Thioredoxin [Wickerhamomyces ciferrii]